MKSSFCIFIFSFLVCNIVGEKFSQAQLAADPLLVSKKIYQTLTGRFLQPGTPMAQNMIQAIQAGSYLQAAQFATEEVSFTDAVVRDWAANLLTKNTDPLLTLNDSLSYFIGSTRDNLNAKYLLTGDYTYGLTPKFGLGQPSDKNNDAFVFLENNFRDLKSSLYRYAPQWPFDKAKDSGGVLTTRYWATVNYSAGTNRRAVVNTLEVFLCKPNQSWKTPNLSIRRIRQDIDRFPAGNAQTFQTECRSCHAIMDGLAGAFAKVNSAGASNIDWSTDVQPKYLQHSEIYPDGFVTTDASWVNFIDDPDGSWGWKTVKTGTGVHELGIMLSETEAFKKCMVKTVVKSICRKDLKDNYIELNQLAQNWVNSGMGLKDLFMQVAVSPVCLEQGKGFQ